MRIANKNMKKNGTVRKRFMNEMPAFPVSEDPNFSTKTRCVLALTSRDSKFHAIWASYWPIVRPITVFRKTGWSSGSGVNEGISEARDVTEWDARHDCAITSSTPLSGGPHQGHLHCLRSNLDHLPHSWLLPSPHACFALLPRIRIWARHLRGGEDWTPSGRSTQMRKQVFKGALLLPLSPCYDCLWEG